jgi:superfamily II DNA/RNA helicase
LPNPPLLRADGLVSTVISITIPQAVDAARAGHHVVVSTSTASGKSLCYLLPVLEALAADRRATALFMFPTKALAQVTQRLPPVGHSFLSCSCCCSNADVRVDHVACLTVRGMLLCRSSMPMLLC